MEHKRESRKGPMCRQRIFDKGAKAVHWKITFSTNVAGTLE